MQSGMKKWFFLIAVLLFTLTAQADVADEYVYEGTLGDRIPVRITFCVNGEEIAVGEIYYPKAKHPAPILLVGRTEDWGYSLKEYQDDGTITGVLSLKMKFGETEGDADEFLEGVWMNPKTGKKLPLKNMELVNRNVDNVLKYLDYEDPQNIGREYAYQEWDGDSQKMMTGHITFRGAGKNKLHFNISNERHGIAKGKSAPDSPAVLGETTHDYFYYEKLNECGYGFGAYFFKRFVVLKTISGPETLKCFGEHASFDGVYMKVKQ